MAKNLTLGFHLADDFYKIVLKRFPSPCTYCFAYGSAVFPQQDQKPGKMIDLVFVVDDPVSWHRENLKMNRNHYSALGWLGPKFLASVQENMASGVFYNPFVKVENKLIKYGVISTQAFRDDLTKWKSFYIAGRLQKPVRNLQSPVKSLIPCIEKNRLAALSFSLIHLPMYTSTIDLYVTIAKLSYMGDFRMHVGEHPRKAVNIVVPLIKEFDKIYYPLLKNMRPTVQLDGGGRIVQETNARAVFQHMMKLPHSVQCSLVSKVGRTPKYYCVEDTMADLCQTTDVKQMLNKEIKNIVFSSSIRQTIQGIFSAGVIKSIRYGLEKLKKKTGTTSDDGTQTQLLRVLSALELTQMDHMASGSKKRIIAGGGPLFDGDYHPGVGDCDYLAVPAPVEVIEETKKIDVRDLELKKDVGKKLALVKDDLEKLPKVKEGDEQKVIEPAREAELKKLAPGDNKQGDKTVTGVISKEEWEIKFGDLEQLAKLQKRKKIADGNEETKQKLYLRDLDKFTVEESIRMERNSEGKVENLKDEQKADSPPVKSGG